MFRRLIVLSVVLGALAAAPLASAAAPTPYAAQGGKGLLSLDGSLRFFATKAGADTAVSAIRTSGGATVQRQTVSGAYGIPTLTQDGLAGGLFHDGSAFVLQNVGNPRPRHGRRRRALRRPAVEGERPGCRLQLHARAEGEVAGREVAGRAHVEACQPDELAPLNAVRRAAR